jgi:hypothetical protein
MGIFVAIVDLVELPAGTELVGVAKIVQQVKERPKRPSFDYRHPLHRHLLLLCPRYSR